jgi:hypothetical protein
MPGALGVKPADVAPFIRVLGTNAPKREAALVGRWVSDHWAAGLTVRQYRLRPPRR